MELLDYVPRAAAERNLRDLARINRWFGGHRVLLGLMRGLASPNESFSVLDIGAASGDMGRAIARNFPKATIVSLDRRQLHLREAPSPRVVADALLVPFRARSFDFVLCSSFLHHFHDADVIRLIASLQHLARRGLILLDVERHAMAYRFLPWTRWLLRWSRLTAHDGPASVAASFCLEELVSLARAAGANVVAARRHSPWFRVSVIIDPRSPISTRFNRADQENLCESLMQYR
jgi:SAM-dependent methyltransferase